MNENFKKIILIIIIICMLIIYVISRIYEIKTEEQMIETTVESIVETENNIVETIETIETTETTEPTEITEPTELVEEVIEETSNIVLETTEETVIEEAIETEDSPSLINLGRFVLTAYCSCSKCCGQYALNRPIDENGNEIVYGASGQRLVAGLSVAVDPYVIPYGSEIIINEHTYIAHDTGSGVNGYHIDVYFDNHQEACNFGVQYAEVYMIEN